jgi:hypothetical protein
MKTKQMRSVNVLKGSVFRLGMSKLGWGRQTLDALRRLAPSDTVLSKILWQNARRLLPSSLTRAVSREPGAMV